MKFNAKGIGGFLTRTSRFHVLASIMVLVIWAAFAGLAQAAMPAAGTVIGNQASATYTDASAISRTATSNTVTTTVQQVAAFTLTATQSKTVSPGGTVYYPHTLTNTGNGTDSFGLTAADAGTGAITFSGLSIFADADGNGVPDNSTAISTTGNTASNGVFKFVVAATVPGSATSGQGETITVTGTSVFSGSVTQTNTDTVTVTGNAVINVTKSLSIVSGPSPSSSNITVTLTYTNTGNTTATAVTITDTIGTGATSGMAYVTGSGGWSGGATVTDAAAGDSSGLAYDWNITTTNKVTAVISSVAPATTGKITFNVTVNSGLTPGTTSTSNTAAYTYNDGTGSVGPTNTNTAVYTVTQTGGVVANGSSTVSTNGENEPVTVASANQGATVSFNNYIWNTGNGSDSFDITTGSSSFPAGTTFQLYKSDGVTPLTDSNGNGVPDTGPVAADASYKVVLQATLPATATGGAFSVTKTATSFYDSSKSNTVTDTLTTITGSTVDITNNYARGNALCDETGDACGYGAGPEASPVTTKTVDPGSSTTFTLYINNTSSVADSYDMLADDDGTFATANDLPTGWTITFKLDGGAGDCSTTGATITNTGVINSSANKALCAIVSVPSGYAAGNVQMKFRARSSTTGATDIKYDQVTVNTIRSISLTPNNSGQIYPGGSVVFSHTITNTGNVLEGNGTASTITLTLADSLSGWSSVVYYDSNGNGTIDSGEPVVSSSGLHSTTGLSGGLGLGGSAKLLVKVFAPAGAAIGDINTTTLTATTANGTYTTTAPSAVSAQETTQVISGQVRLDKTQVLDADCSGENEHTSGSYSNAQITTGAVPGACIRYKIVATNDGTANVTTLVLSDSTPANTTYDDGSRNSAGGTCATGAVDAAAATTQGTITAPSCGSTGSVQATVGTLTPGQSVTIKFGVMINN